MFYFSFYPMVRTVHHYWPLVTLSNIILWFSRTL